MTALTPAMAACGSPSVKATSISSPPRGCLATSCLAKAILASGVMARPRSLQPVLPMANSTTRWLEGRHLGLGEGIEHGHDAILFALVEDAGEVGLDADLPRAAILRRRSQQVTREHADGEPDRARISVSRGRRRSTAAISCTRSAGLISWDPGVGPEPASATTGMTSISLFMVLLREELPRSANGGRRSWSG